MTTAPPGPAAGTEIFAGHVRAQVVPVPWIEKLYGFSSESSLAMLNVAVRSPAALGSNTTVNVVVPLVAATGDVG